MRVVRTILTLAAAVLAAAPALAQSPSPYDRTYRLRAAADTPLHADMTDGSAVVGTVPAGASGIVLRWCRSEIPFGAWQFGSLKEQHKLLDERWCEISVGGKVGNVPGSVLTPE